MASVTFKGSPVKINGNLPEVGSQAPDFKLIGSGLNEINLSDYKGKKVVLNIFPSIDTDTCAASVRTFNKNAAELGNVAVINLSLDLPFAQKRFCGAEGIDKVVVASLFRSDFLKYLPIDFTDGPLKGLTSRVIMVINEKNEIIYTEQVAEIVNEPNYQEALVALNS